MNREAAAPGKNIVMWADIAYSDEEDLRRNAADATQFGIQELAREELTRMEESTCEDDSKKFVDDSTDKTVRQGGGVGDSPERFR